MFTLFVCGVLSKEGFKYKELEGNKLPQKPSNYLDMYDFNTMSSGSTYVIEHIEVDRKEYALMIEYRKIVPRNDTSYSDYLHIGVGVLTSDVVDTNDSIAYYQMIKEVHTNLLSKRDEKNAFPHNYKLSEYSFQPRKINKNTDYVVDTFCRVSSKKRELFKFKTRIICNDIMNVNKGTLHYLSENENDKSKIVGLKGDVVKWKQKLSNSKDNEYELEKEKITQLATNEEIKTALEEETNVVKDLKEDIETEKDRYTEIASKYSDLEEKFKKLEKDFEIKDEQLKSHNELENNHKKLKKEYSFLETEIVVEKQKVSNISKDNIKLRAEIESWKFSYDNKILNAEKKLSKKIRMDCGITFLLLSLAVFVGLFFISI